jgi:hypothetical protein
MLKCFLGGWLDLAGLETFEEMFYFLGWVCCRGNHLNWKYICIYKIQDFGIRFT